MLSIGENYYNGLIAEWYDDWLKARKEDVDFYSEFFSGFSGRVLELACGTGRILLPIAKRGIAIDGLDSSTDMLAKLIAKASDAGIPTISTYKQPMTNFELPGTYDAIFIAAGSFQLLISENEALDCLKTARKHLTQSGFLLMDVFVPWSKIRADKVETFAVTRDSNREDGSRCIVSERFSVDIVNQVVESVFRYEIFKAGRLEISLVKDFPLRWYWKGEIESLIRKAGFTAIEFLNGASLYKEGSVFVLKAS